MDDSCKSLSKGGVNTPHDIASKGMINARKIFITNRIVVLLQHAPNGLRYLCWGGDGSPTRQAPAFHYQSFATAGMISLAKVSSGVIW